MTRPAVLCRFPALLVRLLCVCSAFALRPLCVCSAPGSARRRPGSSIPKRDTRCGVFLTLFDCPGVLCFCGSGFFSFLGFLLAGLLGFASGRLVRFRALVPFGRFVFRAGFGLFCCAAWGLCRVFVVVIGFSVSGLCGGLFCLWFRLSGAGRASFGVCFLRAVRVRLLGSVSSFVRGLCGLASSGSRLFGVFGLGALSCGPSSFRSSLAGASLGMGWAVGVVRWFVFFSGSRVRAGLGWSGLGVGGGRRCRWSRRGRLVRNVGARVRAKRSYEEAGGLDRGEAFARSPIRRTGLFDASVLVVGSRRGVRGEGSADLGAALPGPHPLPPKAQSRAAVPSSAPPTTSDAQWTPG